MNLQLSLKRQWFDMTKSGEKKEDYREITPYWCNRLLLVDGKRKPKKWWDDFLLFNGESQLSFTDRIQPVSFNQNTTTLGYPSKDDTDRIIKFKHAGIEIRTGRPEWGAEEGKVYFVIKHGERLKQ